MQAVRRPAWIVPLWASLVLLLLLNASADAMLLTMLLRRSSLSSMLPKPVIKIYHDLDSDHSHGPGIRSGIKVGIDATFGGRSKDKHQHHHHHDHRDEYEDGDLSSKYPHQHHDDYKLQQGDYDLHRYQKSPSITFEIRAPEEPDHSDHYRPRYKTAYGGSANDASPSGESPSSAYSLRRFIKRRRKTTPRPTLPPPPPPPPPPVIVLPSYRKELMYPYYRFGPYKGHSIMGFTYDADKDFYVKKS